MRRLLILAALSSLLLANVGSAQVLTLEEMSRRKKEPLALPRDELAIVDINSTIQISLDHDSIRRRAGELFPEEPEVDVDEVRALASILEQEADILALFGQASRERSYAERLDDLDRGSAALLGVLQFAEKREDLADRVEQVLGRTLDPVETYSAIFEITRDEVSRLNRALDEAFQHARISFRLAGWIQNENGIQRPIHVPRFDEFEQGRFYEVPRYVIRSDEELRAGLEVARRQAQAFNERGLSGLLEFGNRFDELADDLLTAVTCLRDVVAAADLTPIVSGNQEAAAAAERLIDRSDALITKVSNLESAARRIANSPDPFGQSLALLSQAQAALTGIPGDISELTAGFADIALIARDLAPQVVAEEAGMLNRLLADGELCSNTLLNGVQSVSGELELIRRWTSKGVDQSVRTNEEFSESVLRFLIDDNIPTSTEIDLRYTGERSAGDEVHIVAVVEKADPEDLEVQTMELERRTLRMYQIDWHARMSVGLVFVDPLKDGDIELERQFQAAPSYSILLRRGSRNSLSWNDFWSVGFGLNVAAPDFNMDTTPEIALGAVVSTARDFIQAGGGRNLGADAWYWFFGLRLPVGVISVPSVDQQGAF